MFYVLSRDWDKENILGPHGIRFLMGTQNFSLSQALDETKNVLLHVACCHQKLRGNMLIREILFETLSVY